MSTTTDSSNRQTWRLIYISRNEIQGTESEIQAEIQKILAVSRLRNDADGVCGALLFNQDCFAQALEGSLSDVQKTFERIQCDPRHSDAVILGFEPVPAPVFSAWSMAYVGNDSGLDRQFQQIGINSGYSPQDLSADSLFDLMQLHLAESEARGNLQRAA